MGNTFFYERTPFDILVKNFFQDNTSNTGSFLPLTDTKITYPVDIYTSKDKLVFEIACTGIPKEELEIQIQDNILKIIYNKNKDTEGVEYIHRGIAKRSFNLGWKVDSKFDLKKAEASFENGLLTVSIPFSEESQIKTLSIK